jgi:imidazolonepropionase
MLRVARDVAQQADLHLYSTFLGAHALPAEFAQNRVGYVDLLCDSMLPAVAASGLAQAVDVFCENIAFSPCESARILKEATALGLARMVHADQLSDLGGAAIAAEFAALAAAHLEYTSADSVRAMAAVGTVAVLLPAAFYCMRETTQPPLAALRAAGVALAVATDCNPGTSPCASLLTAMHLGCVLLGLTPEEALRGATANAAAALGLSQDRGQLQAGMRADFAIWDVDDPLRLVLELGMHRPLQVFRDGHLRSA